MTALATMAAGAALLAWGTLGLRRQDHAGLAGKLSAAGLALAGADLLVLGAALANEPHEDGREDPGRRALERSA